MKVYPDKKQVKNLKRVKDREILRRIKALEVDPFLGKELKGRENTHSLRVGKFRVIY